MSREFEKINVRVARVRYPQLPAWLPGRIRGCLAKQWFVANEYRLKQAFDKRQLVHYFFPENTLFEATKWKRGGSLLLSCHQPVEHLKASPYMQKRPFFYDGLKASDAIVLMASCEIEQYRELAPNSEVLCIPHGVDSDFFSPGTFPGKEDGTFRILTVGNWLRDYDQWAAVVERVASEYPNVEFSVLANQDRLASAAENLKIGRDNIRLLSGISDEQLRDEYRRADVVFLPLKDAWANNALLESMSCGRPLLVTDLPATREYAGAAAMFMSKDDADAAAQRLLELRNQPETRAELGRKARIRIEAEYGWELIARQHLNLYAGLLS